MVTEITGSRGLNPGTSVCKVDVMPITLQKQHEEDFSNLICVYLFISLGKAARVVLPVARPGLRSLLPCLADPVSGPPGRRACCPPK